MPSLRKFAKNLNYLLGWIELFCLAVFFATFIIAIYYLDTDCILVSCKKTFGGFPLDINFYNVVVKYILPSFVSIGCTRMGLNFFANRRDSYFHLSFYASLLGIFLSFLLFGLNASEFAYFHIKSKVQIDSVYIVYELALFALTSALILKNKKIWDKSTFFVKIRLMFYIFQIVLLVINMNLAISFFAISCPILIFIDLNKKIHYNWEEVS